MVAGRGGYEMVSIPCARALRSSALVAGRETAVDGSAQRRSAIPPDGRRPGSAIGPMRGSEPPPTGSRRSRAGVPRAQPLTLVVGGSPGREIVRQGVMRGSMPAPPMPLGCSIRIVRGLSYCPDGYARRAGGTASARQDSGVQSSLPTCRPLRRRHERSGQRTSDVAMHLHRHSRKGPLGGQAPVRGRCSRQWSAANFPIRRASSAGLENIGQ